MRIHLDHFIFIFIISSIVIQTKCYYLSGENPSYYNAGGTIPFYANSLTSTKTQLPRDYYSLPFCRPNSTQSRSLNLGEVLQGDRLYTTKMDIRMLIGEECRVICASTFDESKVPDLKKKVEEEYRVHMLADNFPAATPVHKIDDTKKTIYYRKGYSLGGVKISGNSTPEYFLNNHVNIVMYYNKLGSDQYALVGFDVVPQSLQHSEDYDPADPLSYPSTCNSPGVPFLYLDSLPRGVEPQPTTTERNVEVSEGDTENTSNTEPTSPPTTSPSSQKSENQQVKVIWTYSLRWVESNITWDSRWDRYLRVYDTSSHWLSISYSLVVAVFLTGVVAVIMIKTLYFKLGKLNQELNNANEEDESGWKLLHGDIFRPPARPLIFAVIVGTGVQLVGMVTGVMAFGMLGFLSPANSGGLMTFVVVLYMLMGLFGGYFGAKTYKIMKGNVNKKLPLLICFVFPTIITILFTIQNIVLWKAGSTVVVGFPTVVGLFFMWLFICVSLTTLGSYFSTRRAIDTQQPTQVNQIPRYIPDLPWYSGSVASVLTGGIFPFAIILVNLSSILTAIWSHQYFYYAYGYLFVNFLLLIVACFENSIVICYYMQLVHEDYRWWWRSYLHGAVAGVYYMIYCILFLFTKLDIDNSAGYVLYFTRSLMMSLVFAMLTGTLGFYGCLYFLRRIYSSKHFS